MNRAHTAVMVLELAKHLDYDLHKSLDRELSDDPGQAQRSLDAAVTVALTHVGWVNAEDRKPSNGRMVLVASPSLMRVRMGWWGSFDGRWHVGTAGVNHPVTHWMSLPEPPFVDETDGE